MNIGFNLKQKIAGASIVVALVSAGCAVAPNRPNIAAPGSSYVTQERNSGSFGTQNVRNTVKVVGERMWQGRKVFMYDGTLRQVMTEPQSGAWIAMTKDDAPVLSFDPPVGWDYPLYVGKTGTGKYRFTVHATKQSGDFERTWRVDAYEDVTVPAGTFKCYKVFSSDTTGNENVVWWSPELGTFVKQNNRRTEKHGAGAGTNDVELVSHAITIAR